MHQSNQRDVEELRSSAANDNTAGVVRVTGLSAAAEFHGSAVKRMRSVLGALRRRAHADFAEIAGIQGGFTAEPIL